MRTDDLCQVSNRIPLTKIGPETDEERKAILEAFERVLSSGRYILGPEVQRFENRWAEHCYARACVGVGNGTDAIKIALRASGIKRGSYVVTVANSAPATVEAIIDAGMVPWFCEIDENGLMKTESAVEQAKVAHKETGNWPAFLPVHLFGQFFDVEELWEAEIEAGNSDPVIVVDSCQAHGSGDGAVAVLHDIYARATAFSFYPTKNLGALGDAGAIVTNDTTIEMRARRLRNYGFVQRDKPGECGYNSRMDEVQAAILAARMAYLEENLEARHRIVERYRSAFNMTKTDRFRFIAGDSCHLAVVACYDIMDSKKLAMFLHDRGIETGKHYPVSAEFYPFLNPTKKRGETGTTFAWCDRIVTLPLWPMMQMESVDRVAREVMAFFGIDAYALAGDHPA